MRIFRLQKLGAEESLENLVVLIRVCSLNVVVLGLVSGIFIAATVGEIRTAHLVGSMGAAETLFRKYVVLIFKI